MGGTSTDVALCPGQVPVAIDTEIAGLPLRLPAIAIHTVGAGGGSIAHVDAGVRCTSAQRAPVPIRPGLLFQSAGTDRQSLVADSYRCQSRPRPIGCRSFSGRVFALGNATSVRCAGKIGARNGCRFGETAAWDVIRVANATMERAIRKISVERGYDPRLFTLVPFGGAGPLHACELADSLQIPRVLIPPTPGVLSALGMLVAVPTKTYSRTVMVSLDARAGTTLKACFDELSAQAYRDMAVDGYDSAELQLTAAIDMRYAGQSHELTIAIDDDDEPAALFHAAHDQRYGYHQPDAAIELVTVRLTATAPVKPAAIAALAVGDTGVNEVIIGRKPIILNAGHIKPHCMIVAVSSRDTILQVRP